MSIFNRSFSIRGEFDLHKQKVRIDGEGNQIPVGPAVHVHSGSNLITDTGMNYLGSSVSFYGFFSAVQVGTSNTAPANSDTALGGRVAGVVGSVVPAWDTTNPRAAVMVGSYVFAAGAATGVLAELGLSATVSGVLHTRALFLDEDDNPITVTVLADEQLLVTYRVIITASETDSVLTTTQKGTEYTVTLRPALLGVSLGTTMSSARFGAFGFNSGAGATTIYGASYSGVTSAIGAVTAGPTGTQTNYARNSGVAYTFGSYTSGNFYRDDTVEFGLTLGNAANTGAFQFAGAPFFVQIGVSPRLNKTAVDVLRFTVRTSWSRG